MICSVFTVDVDGLRRSRVWSLFDALEFLFASVITSVNLSWDLSDFLHVECNLFEKHVELNASK